MNNQLALELRDQAIDQVASNNKEWMDKALLLLKHYPEPHLTSDDLRKFLHPQIGEPHHYNGWGALCKIALTRKLIEFHGQYAQSARPESHGRAIKRYTLKAA